MGREVTGLAARAHASFTAGKYDEALAHLSQLAPSGAGVTGEPGSDFRTLHNRALCQHGCKGFTDPARLEESLHAIQVQLRRKARETDTIDDGEQDQSVSAGAGTLIGSTGGATAATVGLAELDADASVLLFNLSALHFQQKQYGAAQAVLEHLFLHIEPLDDSLAIHVCFLLLDVLCHSARGSLHTEANLRRFAQQSSAVVAFLERTHAMSSSSSGDGGGGDGRQDDGGGGGNGGSSALSGSAEQTEFAFRLHLYKAKILLLQEQTKTSKKEIKSALEIFQRELRGSNDNTSGGGGAGGGNNSSGTQRAQPQGRFAPVPPPGVQNMAALYLKANLEHLRDNHRKALKLLASCHGFQGAEEYSGPGEAVGPPYFNNMGCLHHKLRRHHVALHYFQKALEALSRGEAVRENGTLPQGRMGTGPAGAKGTKGAKGAKGAAGKGGGVESNAAAGAGMGADGHLSPTPTCEILYNTGLQLLLTDKPQEALRCFERAALLFHNRPHLWLRMAECSIAEHRLRHMREGRMRGGSSAIPSHKPASAAAGNGGKGGVGNPAGISGESSGMEIQQRERRPLPWRTVGVGQHRRVLLPTSSTGGGDCARSDGLVGPGGSAIPPLDDDGMGTEVNGSSTGFSGGTSGVGGPGASAGARRGDAVTALGGKDGREKGTKGGCSLAHASRCLHNVMYLCAAHAQVRAREGKGAKQSGNTSGLLGGQGGVLGVSPRLVAKNMSVSQPAQGNNSTSGAAGNRGAGGDADGNGGGDGDDGRAGGSGTLDASAEEICQVALVDLAYVHLGLNDPVTTLAYTGRLFATKASVVNRHLAHLYAAEALCILGRPSEAMEHLTPLSEESATAAAAAGAWASVYRRPGFAPVSTAGPSSSASGGTNTAGGASGASAAGGQGGAGGAAGIAGVETLSPEAAAEARASLHANLAAVHALQDNLSLAERCARTAMGICPGSVSVLRMAVYVLIRQGNVAEALQVLKEGRLSRK